MSSLFLGRLRAFLILVLLGSLAQGCSDAGAHTLQIDFTTSPDRLAGAQLFVDGTPVGELQPDGSLNVCTFEVDAGDHILEIKKEGQESQPFELVGAEAGGTSFLTARATSWFIEGQLKNALVLEREPPTPPSAGL